ncbi:MAG TPA: endonuclease/exonuclease/phosphatase family protein [Burkholderiales bacterium]|nr:endonuclease/exonuclease/phosphatase family protein [Burkholderiales bacterium]
MNLQVATYNIHKGFSQFNRRMVLHELRDRLRESSADIVFLQEVQGAHALHARRYEDWPAAPQYEFLADTVWSEYAYGRNAVYDHGHHGNAILSRYPIVAMENQDISTHAYESRGLLHCEIKIPGTEVKIHCLCVHLALHEKGRKHQMCAIIDRIRSMVPEDEPMIVAGDFNDWRNRVAHRLADELGMREAFRDHRGRPARSFPSTLPIFRLDRIYVRGFTVTHTEVHHGHPWSKISDHAMLSAQLLMQSKRL